MDFQVIAEKFGVPLLVLAAGGYGFYKLFWPLHLRFINNLFDQLTQQRQSNETIITSALKLVEECNGQIKAQGATLQTLTRHVETITTFSCAYKPDPKGHTGNHKVSN